MTTHTPFTEKYKPRALNEIVFGSEEVTLMMQMYEKGFKSGSLILWGTQGTGKSTIANLLPAAVEGKKTTVDVVHAKEIKGNIYRLISRMQNGRSLAYIQEQRYYLVIEEFAFNDENCSVFWTELDKIQGDTMVIICTNEINKLPRSLVSRCECLEVLPASPAQFLGRAKWILDQEGLLLSDADVLKTLQSVAHLRDNRKYLSHLETVVGMYRLQQEELAANTK